MSLKYSLSSTCCNSNSCKLCVYVQD